MIGPVSGSGAGISGRSPKRRHERVSKPRGSDRSASESESQDTSTPGRALALIGEQDARGDEALRGAGTPFAQRGNAAFLTHLIATRENLPQTRARRRSDPATTTSMYQSVSRSTINTTTGRILRHTA